MSTNHANDSTEPGSLPLVPLLPASNKLTKPAARPALSFEKKTEQEIRYRQYLYEDLLAQRTHYRSGPYEAHVQYSTFCNMSCIMCWDGRNPPTKKTTPEILKLIDEQVAPHLSVITPYSGSEPLVLSWDETRHTAESTSTLLCITTNCQYLTEERFHELKDITETLLLSIDSHIHEIFRIIRPGGNVEKVFKNLESTARLCKEHGVECIINIVLMTHNAPHLAETIEYLGDLGFESVNIIQLLDVNGRSSFYDPLLHYSQEYIAWVKQRCLAMIEKKQMRMTWSVAGWKDYDFRPDDHVRPMVRKSWSNEWDERMRRTFPGFCKMAFNRLRIDGEGDVAPCCYAIEGALSLGNLKDKTFDEIWNGPEAQDLRRGMLCGDVPAHCSSCRFIDPIEPQNYLPFMELIDRQTSEGRPADPAVECSLQLPGPAHASRIETTPVLKITNPLTDIAEFRLVVSLAGECEQIVSASVRPDAIDGNILSFKMPDQIFNQLKTNVGSWWNIWAIPTDPGHPVIRSEFAKCLIRHQHLVRINESKLRYKDAGALPVVDLGVDKQLGFASTQSTPDRPEILVKRAASSDATSNPESVTSHATKQTDGAVSFAMNELIASPPEKSVSMWQKLARRFGRNRNRKHKASIHSATNDLNFNKSVLDGYLDQVKEYPDFLHVVGWKMLRTGPADEIVFESRDGQSVPAKSLIRPDLGSAYPKLSGASGAGFEGKLKAKRFKTEYGYEFTIVAKLRGYEISRVLVNRFESPDDGSTSGPFWFGKSERLTIR